MLTQGKVAFVDAGDLERVRPYTWCAGKYKNKNGTVHWYAITNEKQPDGTWRHLKMHRLLLDAKKGQLVDHVDNDGLNNRRSNIRIVTPGQNQYNAVGHVEVTSKYKGVWWHTKMEKWQAGIRQAGRLTHLGTFENEVEAAIAYDIAALELRAEHSRLNFPREVVTRLVELAHLKEIRRG